jgi:peptidoglycan DL-endopeptidase CwlO
VNSVASQDSQVIFEVTRFKRDVTKRAAFLKAAHARQEHVVAKRTAAKQQVEAGLAGRQRLLGSIKDEIVRLQAEERARQERLRIEAQRRLQGQLAAQQRAIETAQAHEVVGASAVSPDESVTVAPPSRYGGVVGIAMQYLGVPYVWGGASPSGFDCSGLTMYVYAQVGVSLPHTRRRNTRWACRFRRVISSPAISCSSPGLGIWACTSEAASSSTLRTPAMS